MQKVMVVGGTHGNEWGGIYLLRKWQEQRPAHWQDYPFEISLQLANPAAIAANRRYLDQDLNRSFLPAALADPSLQNTENQRARELAPHLQDVDFLFDLHNTTANMGCSLILSRPDALQDPLTLQLCAHLCQLDPRVKVYFMPVPLEQSPYLPSLAQRDITVEIGPMAHGTLQAELFLLTEKVMLASLDFLADWQQGKAPHYQGELTVYEQLRNLDYPRNAQGELAGMVHPSLQGADFEPLQPGQPVFMDFAGQPELWQEPQTVWPVFINEQAYYEKGFAMSLTQKQQLTL